MSKIRVNVLDVQVIEGQGVGEGDFELRLAVQEGSNNVVWPTLNGWAKVDKSGPPLTINREVATYTVNTGTLSKKYVLDITEHDQGTLGRDDIGQGTLTFDLKPDMAPATKSVTISLKRPNMNFEGKVKVTMVAQRV